MDSAKLSEERIISLIFSVGRNFRQDTQKKAPTQKFECAHISIVQLETLKFIAQKKNVLMKDIANYLSIAPPSLTPLIDHLEERQLIKRTSSQNDRRAIFINLTSKGKEALKKIMKKKVAAMHYLFQKLSKDEQKTLIHILEKLATTKE